MELTKREVSYLYEQPCYRCKWSGIDPFDWGLRCCNSDSEHCTDYCPDAPCKHFEEEVSERIRIIRDSALEDVRNREKCPECDGAGFYPDPHGVDLHGPLHLLIPCWTCKGRRFIKKRKPNEKD